MFGMRRDPFSSSADGLTLVQVLPADELRPGRPRNGASISVVPVYDGPMRNKWYVIGLLVPTLLLVWATIHIARGAGGLLALLPAALAAALAVAAIRVARSDSFAPAGPQRWNTGQTVGMTRWLKHRADDAAAADAEKLDAARAARRPPA